jgi:CRP/FNR family transcriptional regulator
MPSAPQKEIEEPERVRADEPPADLPSLLQTIHGSNGKLNSLHGRGRILFAEGEPARGVYILRTGRATVSITSRDMVGLNATLRNSSYDTTVKTVEPCRTDFVSRVELIELMQSQAGAQAVANVMSRELSELTARAKLLLLPQTVSGRLAKLLLEWSNENGSDTSGAVRLHRVFTHEEMAQMICSSRETVSRLLASLSKQQVIRVTTDSIVISDRGALENIAHAT